MTIHKYPLAFADIQNLILPLNAQILTVQMQHELPCLWALVEPINTDKQTRTIEIFGTGNPMDNHDRAYLGTIQQFKGHLIWHVFERLSSQ